MAKAVVVQRYLYKDDNVTLPRDLPPGTILYRYIGEIPDGVISPGGVAVTEDEVDASYVFEVPLDALIPPTEEFAQRPMDNDILRDTFEDGDAPLTSYNQPDLAVEPAPELDQFQGFGSGNGGGGGAGADWERNDNQGGNDAGSGDDDQD